MGQKITSCSMQTLDSGIASIRISGVGPTGIPWSSTHRATGLPEWVREHLSAEDIARLPAAEAAEAAEKRAMNAMPPLPPRTTSNPAGTGEYAEDGRSFVGGND